MNVAREDGFFRTTCAGIAFAAVAGANSAIQKFFSPFFKRILSERAKPMFVQNADQSDSVGALGANDSLGYDFALLGLRAREARVDRIRRAAESTAERIRRTESNADDHRLMLTDLAVSTYRLLDPRKRSKMLERVQLCIIGEDEFARLDGSSVPLAPAPTHLATVPRRLEFGTHAVDQSVSHGGISTAIDLC